MRCSHNDSFDTLVHGFTNLFMTSNVLKFSSASLPPNLSTKAWKKDSRTPKRERSENTSTLTARCRRDAMCAATAHAKSSSRASCVLPAPAKTDCCHVSSSATAAASGVRSPKMVQSRASCRLSLSRLCTNSSRQNTSTSSGPVPCKGRACSALSAKSGISTGTMSFPALRASSASAAHSGQAAYFSVTTSSTTCASASARRDSASGPPPGCASRRAGQTRTSASISMDLIRPLTSGDRPSAEMWSEQNTSGGNTSKRFTSSPHTLHGSA
mmetsp:Transcript_33415/g.70023  ORF Transcript_33415/g.70023 Transcript_33415/m.70023 type:complete len:270 (-) Transcript_33415:2356-3165(-)